MKTVLDRLRQWRERTERLRLQAEAKQGTHTTPVDYESPERAQTADALKKLFGF